MTPDPTQTIPTPYYDWRYNGRIDHRINDKNTFSASYTNQNNRGANDQNGSTSDLSQNNFTTNQLIIANASLNSVISPTIVNSVTFRLSILWNNLISTNSFVPNLSFPDLTIGTNGNVPQQTFQKKWQFKDDIAFNHGKHSFKTGFDYLWEPVLGGGFFPDRRDARDFLLRRSANDSVEHGQIPAGICDAWRSSVHHRSYYRQFVLRRTQQNVRPVFPGRLEGVAPAHGESGPAVGQGHGVERRVHTAGMSRAYLELKAIGNPYAEHPERTRIRTSVRASASRTI